MRITPAGSVGIGTPTPGSMLHVARNGDAHLRIESTNDTNERTGIALMETTALSSPYGFLIEADGSNNSLAIGHINGGSFERAGGVMFFDGSNGNVGIGTDIPDVLLTLREGTNGDLLKFNTERAWRFTTSGSGPGTTLDLRAEANDKQFRVVSEDGSFFPLVVRAANSAVNNRVGIRTTSPATALDVNGTVTAIEFNCADCIDAADIGANAVANSELFNGGTWSLTSGLTISGANVNVTGAGVNLQNGGVNVCRQNGFNCPVKTCSCSCL
jgi:hypothetical protein